MRNLPVNLGGFKLRVVDTPELKTKEDKNGNVVPATTYAGESQWVVSLHAKVAQADEKGRKPKGEEIRVTVTTDPSDVDDGDVVELVKPQVSPYHTENDFGCSSGLSFKAVAVAKVVAPSKSSKAS